MGVAKISNIFRVLDIPDISSFLKGGGGGGGGLNSKGCKPTDEEKIEYPPGSYICTYILFIVLTFIFGLFTSSFLFCLLCFKFCLQKGFFPLLSFAFCILTFGFLLLSFVF